MIRGRYQWSMLAHAQVAVEVAWVHGGRRVMSAILESDVMEHAARCEGADGGAVAVADVTEE